MGIIACLYRAAEWRHKEIELAAHDLLQRLDACLLASSAGGSAERALGLAWLVGRCLLSGQGPGKFSPPFRYILSGK